MKLKDGFIFFGLPAGEYEIEVRAQGYKPSITHYTVIPGAIKELYCTELIPEQSF